MKNHAEQRLVVAGSHSRELHRQGELSPEEYAKALMEEAREVATRVLEHHSVRYDAEHPPIHTKLFNAAIKIGASMIDGFNFDRSRNT